MTCHFLVGAALAVPFVRSGDLTPLFPGWSLPVASGLLAASPDLDLAGRRLFGIPYDSLFSHRGLFHSPCFLILFSAALAALVAGRRIRSAFNRLWLVWGACMLTHPLLDALTSGGRGVMLLLPFSRARVFFPWRPIYTTPGGIETLMSRAWILRSSEIPFCLAAMLIGVTGLIAQRKLYSKAYEQAPVQIPKGPYLDRN